MPTLDELGQKVKAKYPGVYDDMPDAEVAQKVQAKFPGKYDDFSEPSQADFADVVGGSSAPTPFQQQAKSRFASLEASAPPSERLSVKNAIADTRAFAAKPLVNVSHAIGMDNPDKMAAISNVLDPATVLAGTAGIRAAEGFTSPEAIAGIVSPTIGLAQAAHGATQLPGQVRDAYRDIKSGDVSRFLTETGTAAASNLAMTTALGVGHGKDIVARGREAIRPPEMDMSSIRPEDLGAESRVPDTATAEGTPNVANARRAEAVAALEKFKNELPEPPATEVPGPPEVSPEWLASIKKDGRAYRGMTADEYKATVLLNGKVKSRGDYSFPEEGTSFAADPDTAESYVNFGRDDPRKTGRPTYLTEVDSAPLKRWPDGYLKTPEPIPVARAWEMKGAGDRILASEHSGPSSVEAPQPFDADPQAIIDFNKWVEDQAPPGGYREIQDAAAGHAENPTPVEIQEVGRRLAELERKAAEGQPAEAAPGENGAGGGAVGSLGEAAGAQGERTADPAARSGGPAEAGAPEAGNPRDVQRQAEAGQAAPGAEGLPVENPQHTQATIRDFQKQADRPVQEESRFSRGWDETLDAARSNNDPLLARALRARPGERLSDEVRAAGFQRLREMAADPKPEDAAAFDKLSSVLYEAGSELGRGLNFSKALLDRGNIADPAAVIDTAMKATQGKLSVQAKLDLADMSRKAGEMKVRSEEAINRRAEAALARLEGMGEQIKKLTIKDVIGCR